MNRRAFLASSAAIALAGGAYLYSQQRTSAVPEMASRPRLKMPPLLDVSETGRLDLTAQTGPTRFGDGAETNTAGFNQSYLGPTIVMKNGPLSARVENQVNEAVSVHWHGLLVPGDHDGGPHLPIAPGRIWNPDMDIKQQPSTAWYHTHIHERTAVQVYAGLAGIIHVCDGRDDDRGLPTDYGIDDLTIVLQDRRFDQNGRMTYDPGMMDIMHGFTGDTIVVNGQVRPVAAVPGGIVRLRLVNGSNARVYDLSTDDERPLHLIANDGGFLPAPLTINRLRLSPGERAEVLLDFSKGGHTTLVSAGDPNQGVGGMMGRMRRFADPLFDRSFAVLPIIVDETMPARISKIPDKLGETLPDLSPGVAATRRISLDMGMGSGMMRGMMGGFAINGRPFDPERIDLKAERGSVERWIVSSTMLAHPFHIHGVNFQVVRENGRAPRPESTGWKDTAFVDGESELLVSFDQPASREKPFMYHCHILEHEDAGMMGQFVVS